VLAPPAPDELLAAVDFAIGSWGYENRLLYELHRAGWDVSNPCVSVRRCARPPSFPLLSALRRKAPPRFTPAGASFHHHASGIKSDQPSGRVNDQGRSMYKRPSYHPLDPAIPALQQSSHDAPSHGLLSEGAPCRSSPARD
jgi:hypothetical protein